MRETETEQLGASSKKSSNNNTTQKSSNTKSGGEMQLKRKHMNRERGGWGMGDDDANGNGLWIAKNTEVPREKKKGGVKEDEERLVK